MGTWFLDENNLDNDQLAVLNLPPNASRIVFGAAGSGKTLLALWRAKAMQNLGISANFSMIVYTKALRRFIDNGISTIGLEGTKVVHYQKWNGGTVDYIIVDEGQDFSTSEVIKMKNAARVSMMVFGDTAQQLYQEKTYGLLFPEKTLSINEIAGITGCNTSQLPNNYRIPMTVAKFAQYLNSTNNDITTNCKNTTSSLLPKIIKFNTWKEELDYIINTIKIREMKDVAILLPFNKKEGAGISPDYYSVENTKDYFEEKGVKCLFKIEEYVDLDFSSTLPKIMTYHSSKGLQFETVFIPHCGISWDKYKNALYVAMTRTSRDLIITYSDKISHWFNRVPAFLYQTK
jgi:DNA helicase IV